MIVRQNIENGLYDWASTVINNIQWIFVKQNAPVPQNPFGTIYVTGINTLGQDVVRYEYDSGTDNLNEFVEGPRLIRADFNIFGNGAFDLMSQLRASVAQTEFNIQLMNFGLAFIESSEINDLTEIISSTWNERAQIELRFYVTSQYSAPIVRIAEVNIAGNIQPNDIDINIKVMS